MKQGYKSCRRCNGSGQVIDPIYVGNQMRVLRMAEKKSLRGVARMMGLSAAYISDLELGRRDWNDSLKKAYVRAVAQA